MKVSVTKEVVIDDMDKINLVRSYWIKDQCKSNSYWFIYLNIPMFFLFKGKVKGGINRIEIGPCINWTKYLLVIEWN